MLKSSLFLATLLVSSVCFASKARLASLQGADHLVDIQTVFTNPAHLNLLKPYMTYEFGTPQGTPAAEGGFARKLENGNMLAVYLGHNNANDLRDGTTYIVQRNPIEVTYGSGTTAWSVSASTTDDKKNGKKETTLVAKYGSLIEKGSYYVNVALLSDAEDSATSAKMKAAPQLVLGGDHNIENDRYFGKLNLGNYKSEVGATSTDIKDTGLELGWLNRSLKTAETDIYYGAKLTYAQRDSGGAKITSSSLPVFMGLEHNVNTWAVFRGSLQQNLVIGSTKDETATNTDAEAVAANTTVSSGLGLKYNQLTLDGTLTASTSGTVNGNAFLAQASVTYNF